MLATVTRSAQQQKSPAPEHTGKHGHALPVRERVSAAPGSLLLQRCPGCACGGRCPRCQARAHSATLRVNTPGDAFEQEAERIAEVVVSGSLAAGAVPHTGGAGGAVPQLQRCACGGSCSACKAEEEMKLQRAGEGAAPAVAPPIVHQVLGSAGQPLEPGTRAFMEGRFGADFSGVRVHRDARAAESARAVGAHAYTVGQHVVFGAGEYAPGTGAGRRLLAHELTHVLQQDVRGVLALQRHSCREGEGPPTAEPPIAGEPGPHPLVYRGVSPHRSRRPAVGDAQELLNRFLDLLGKGTAPCAAGADLVTIKQLRATLSEDPLEVDCRFGPNTETATKMFQRCVFPGQPAEWDGKIGPRTWAELVKLRPSPTPTPTPVPTPVPTPPTAFKIVGKSFIARIGTRVGRAPCSSSPFILPIPPGGAPPGISLGGTSPQQRLELFARATDLGFSEDPRTHAKDKSYRLFSERTFRIGCGGSGGVSHATATPVDTDAGREGPLQAPPLIVESSAFAVSGSRVTFSWKVKGRPPPITEPAFQLICFRTSVFIWHEIEGEIDCSGGMPVLVSLAMRDSRFPSDRVFVNGVIEITRRQDTFSRLWIADPSDPTRVE